MKNPKIMLSLSKPRSTKKKYEPKKFLNIFSLFFSSFLKKRISQCRTCFQHVNSNAIISSMLTKGTNRASSRDRFRDREIISHRNGEAIESTIDGGGEGGGTSTISIESKGREIKILKIPVAIPVASRVSDVDPRQILIQQTSATPPPPTITTMTEAEEEIDPPDVSNHPNLRLLNQNCGRITDTKIIGGNRTSINEFPWMALIAYDIGRPNPEFRCGGTVISSRYVLTAAHCVTTLPAGKSSERKRAFGIRSGFGIGGGDFSRGTRFILLLSSSSSSGLRLIGVRVGDHDISKERDCDVDKFGFEVLCAERYQDFGVESIHFHPQYTRRKLQNDIALIRVNDVIDFRPLNAKPICLPLGTAATQTSRTVRIRFFLFFR